MLEASSNIVDLEDRLDAMESASADLTGAWTDVGKWWKARQVTVFTTMNRGAWPMRDPDTSRIGKGVLIRTGELLRAVSSPKPITPARPAPDRRRGRAGREDHRRSHPGGQVKGHEYARRMLKEMLERRVSERLDVIRAAAGEQWPPDPRAYLLADSLPMKEEQFPCVLVTLSNGRPSVNLQSGLGEFIYEYELTVGVALVAPRHDGEEMSSIGRDRVLLAVREALMPNARLADDCFAVRLPQAPRGWCRADGPPSRGAAACLRRRRGV